MNLTMSAEVNSNSPIVGKRKIEIDKEYEVRIISTSRRIESKIERRNPSPDRVIKENDIIEFTGDSNSVIKLFKICKGKY